MEEGDVLFTNDSISSLYAAVVEKIHRDGRYTIRYTGSCSDHTTTTYSSLREMNSSWEEYKDGDR
jgi:hypothetical protein